MMYVLVLALVIVVAIGSRMPDPVEESDCVACEQQVAEVKRQKGLCEANITAGADLAKARIAGLKREEADIINHDGLRQKTAESKRQELKKLKKQGDELHKKVQAAIPGTLPGAGGNLLQRRYNRSPEKPVGPSLDVVGVADEAPPAEVQSYKSSQSTSNTTKDEEEKNAWDHLVSEEESDKGERKEMENGTEARHSSGVSLDVVQDADDAPPLEAPIDPEPRDPLPLDGFGKKVKTEIPPADQEAGSIDVAVTTTTAKPPPRDLVKRWLGCDKNRASSQLALTACQKRSVSEVSRKKARVGQFERSVASRQDATKAIKEQHKLLDRAIDKALDSNARTAQGLKDMGGS